MSHTSSACLGTNGIEPGAGLPDSRGRLPGMNEWSAERMPQVLGLFRQRFRATGDGGGRRVWRIVGLWRFRGLRARSS